jgi:hypothetical protein
MTGTYPVQTYLKRVGLADSPTCPHCTEQVPETLTPFASICPRFREARTSAHNQVRQAIFSLFPKIIDPNWTVLEEIRMGNMGLILRTVSATLVARAQYLPMDDPKRMCDLSQWQPDWVAISQVHKRIAIIYLCRPLDVHREQLHAAALHTSKQELHSPLIYALDYYISQGWKIHVFPLVVGIWGLIHLPHILALLKCLDTPQKHWSTTIASTVLASVKELYFLLCVRF